MPTFSDKHLLDKNTFWSAKFQSWNERSGDLYYTITFFKEKKGKFHKIKEFTVTTMHTGDNVREDDELFEKLKRKALSEI